MQELFPAPMIICRHTGCPLSAASSTLCKNSAWSCRKRNPLKNSNAMNLTNYCCNIVLACLSASLACQPCSVSLVSTACKVPTMQLRSYPRLAEPLSRTQLPAYKCSDVCEAIPRAFVAFNEGLVLKAFEHVASDQKRRAHSMRTLSERQVLRAKHVGKRSASAKTVPCHP